MTTEIGMPGSLECEVCKKDIPLPISTIRIIKDEEFADTKGVRLVLELVCPHCLARQQAEWIINSKAAKSVKAYSTTT